MKGKIKVEKKGFKGKDNKKEFPNRINENIYAKEVRLVGDNVEVGIYSIEKALQIAKEQSLDLVEINPKGDPPVCKIIDYSKFLFDKKKVERELAKKSKKNGMKEIRMGANTGDGDLEHKIKSGRKFLEDGSMVKVTVQFKGRMITHKEIGEILLLKYADALSDVGKAESMPQLSGKMMTMIIKPLK